MAIEKKKALKTDGIKPVRHPDDHLSEPLGSRVVALVIGVMIVVLVTLGYFLLQLSNS